MPCPDHGYPCPGSPGRLGEARERYELDALPWQGPRLGLDELQKPGETPGVVGSQGSTPETCQNYAGELQGARTVGCQVTASFGPGTGSNSSCLPRSAGPRAGTPARPAAWWAACRRGRPSAPQGAAGRSEGPWGWSAHSVPGREEMERSLGAVAQLGLEPCPAGGTGGWHRAVGAQGDRAMPRLEFNSLSCLAQSWGAGLGSSPSVSPFSRCP